MSLITYDLMGNKRDAVQIKLDGQMDIEGLMEVQDE